MKKEYIINEKNEAIIRIFRDNYYKGVDQIKEFIKEAKKDFPFLEDKEINVVVLAGSCNDKVTAIEFKITKSEDVPESYFKWTRRDDIGFCKTYN